MSGPFESGQKVFYQEVELEVLRPGTKNSRVKMVDGTDDLVPNDALSLVPLTEGSFDSLMGADDSPTSPESEAETQKVWAEQALETLVQKEEEEAALPPTVPLPISEAMEELTKVEDEKALASIRELSKLPLVSELITSDPIPEITLVEPVVEVKEVSVQQAVVHQPRTSSAKSPMIGWLRSPRSETRCQ